MIEQTNLTLQVGSNGRIREIVRRQIFSHGYGRSCVSLMPAESGGCIFLEGSDDELIKFAQHIIKTLAGGASE